MVYSSSVLYRNNRPCNTEIDQSALSIQMSHVINNNKRLINVIISVYNFLTSYITIIISPIHPLKSFKRVQRLFIYPFLLLPYFLSMSVKAGISYLSLNNKFLSPFSNPNRFISLLLLTACQCFVMMIAYLVWAIKR